MRNNSLIKILAKRELRTYFSSPIAYIVITIFLIFTGFFFFKDFFYYNQAEMRSLFQLFPLMFTFVVPAITMRQFSEERQRGTFELLVTYPMSSFEVVLGKFIASTVFVVLLIAPTLLYFFTILLVGSPDMGPVIGGYLGTVLLGAAAVSLGLLLSASSRNQIVAFISSWAVIFFFWLIDKVVIYLPSPFTIIQNLGFDFHFQNIARGILDGRDICFFFSVIILALLATAKIVERRR